MDEVDYTRFYYKRNGDSPPEKEKRASGKEPKKPRNFKPLLVVAVVVIMFALLFFSVDFFTDGYIIETVAASLRGNNYEYYLVCEEAHVRDMAYARSLLIRQSGGGGYIITEDDRLLIVYSAYTERTKANNVSEKNANTFVKTVGFRRKNSEFYNALDSAVREISDTVERLEKGSLSDVEARGKISAIRDQALVLKTKAIDQNLPEQINILDYIIGGIDELQPLRATRTEYLGDLRRLATGIIISASTAD